MEEDESIKIFEYIVNEDIVKKCIEEDREITKQDVEGVIQKILRENGIECKTKLEEKWNPEVDRYAQSKYLLYAEVFVFKKDYELSKKILEESKYI